MLKPRLGVAVLLTVLLSAATANAAAIALTWDRNAESTVTGYVVQVGSTPGGTDQAIDIGNQISWTFGSAVAGKTYYFRVLAYNAAGARSLPSNEVSGAAPAPTNVPPYGSFDTPTNNATGLTGSVAVTGWALDDNGVTRVRILRGAVAGEAPGTMVYIGDAARVPGARPDIAAANPTAAQKDRAGWGYLLLSLPPEPRQWHVHALRVCRRRRWTFDAAREQDDHVRKRKLCDSLRRNRYPGPGRVVSGSVTNFGWVLAPGNRRANPPGGGSVRVVIDGAVVGSPSGWTNRPDLTALFPVASYKGIATALGVFTFDSRTLKNGIHSIAWSVTDNMGTVAGVGSRYFTVANASASTAASTATESTASESAATAAVAEVATTPLVGRHGYDLDAPWRNYRANAAGVVVVQSEELDRIELYTQATSGSLVTANGLRHLPIGASLDAGVFTWQPGAGFVGSYDFLFTGPAGDRQVRVVLNPKGSGRVGPQVVIDTPSRSTKGLVTADQPFVIAGWAANLDSTVDGGVDAVHIWAYPRNGGDPIFLGQASLGGMRPDVAAVYGNRFLMSGYGGTATGLPAGDYDIAVFGWSTVLQGWAPASTVTIRVR